LDLFKALAFEETRKSPGWHDEPLKGKWTGHRSVRLNIAYRAIYRITKDGSLDLDLVETVNKHKY
jgi:proteic killer suppression protein